LADVTLLSYPDIAGPMISQVLAETSLTDLRPGSIALTILEAAAGNDFSQEGRLLQLLVVRSIDSASGIDLDNLAGEMGVQPPRQGAIPAQVGLNIVDSAFDKISTLIFAGAAAPPAGSLSLQLVNAGSFPSTGTIYLGRGTPTSESVAYSNPVNSGAFWTLTLTSPLQKNHLVGEEVILAQGGNRPVGAGTNVQVPAGGNQPAIQFTVPTAYTLLDGEDTLANVVAQASSPGSAGNVAAGQISQFPTPPWSTATVTNPTSATGGADAETDAVFRARIKNWVQLLSRGTEQAIQQAVIGTTDTTENKTVVTAYPVQPSTPGGYANLYFDDGSATGYTPPFSGVGVEVPISQAQGGETFVQIQNYPLVESQAASVATEPFALFGGEYLRVVVDGVAEQLPLSNATWANPGVVTAQEVAQAINGNGGSPGSATFTGFTSIEARADSGRLYVRAAVDGTEWIQVTAATLGTDANVQLGFPTRRFYTALTYRKSADGTITQLSQNGLEASLQSLPFSTWPPLSSPQTIQVNVDNIPGGVITLTDSDFSALSTSSSMSDAGLDDWISVLNGRIAGTTSIDNDDGTFIMSSNKGVSAAAAIAIVGGTLLTAIFSANETSSTGAPSDYVLNPLAGQMKLAVPMNPRESLSFGMLDTAGNVTTSTGGPYNLPATLGSPATLVMCPDGAATVRQVAQTANPVSLSVSDGHQIMTGVATQFSNVKAGDWAYFYNLIANGSQALFLVNSVASDGSSISLFSPNPVTVASVQPDNFTITMTFFATSGLPYVVALPIGNNITATALADSLNSQLSCAAASVLPQGTVQIVINRLAATAALAIPAVSGTAASLGIIPGNYANLTPSVGSAESADLLGIPAGIIFPGASDLTPPYNQLNATGTPFSSPKSVNRPVLFYSGVQSRQYREVAQYVSPSELLLRELPPTPSQGLGPDLLGTSTAGLELGQQDNMVFIADNNPTTETFDIPMYLLAQVAGSSSPTNTQMDLRDQAGNLLGSSSFWEGYRFDDYLAWFQASALAAVSTNVNAQLIATAVSYGSQGQRVTFGVSYPSAPGAQASFNYSIDPVNSLANVQAVLPSGSVRSVSVTQGQQAEITSTGSGPYAILLQLSYPTSLSSVAPGDICALDSSFAVANQGPFQVASTTNLVDTQSFQFPVESTQAAIASQNVFTFPVALTYPLQVGDEITVGGISMQAISSAASSVVVASGGAYATGGGSFTCNSTTFTYTAYDGTSTFSGVSPSPVGIVIAGSAVVQTITSITAEVTAVTSQTQCAVAGTPFTNGSGWLTSVDHICVVAGSTPAYTVAVGDWIRAAGVTLDITQVLSQTIFNVNTPFAWSGTVGGTVSRITATLTSSTPGTNQTVDLVGPASVQFYPLTATTPSALIALAASTAGVQDILTLTCPGNGSGAITQSLADATWNASVQLTGGVSSISACMDASPAITLKTALPVAPATGANVLLLPATPRNIAAHLAGTQFSGLSVVAEIAAVNEGRGVQVSTLTPGGSGQIYPVGGRASGNNSLPLIGSGQTVSDNIGLIRVDTAALEMVSPGQTIKLSQGGLARKGWPVTNPLTSTMATFAPVSGTTWELSFGVPFVSLISYTSVADTTWNVLPLSRNRFRFQSRSTVSLTNLAIGQWVYVGSGSSYAGVTPPVCFSGANQGWFQVVDTDASTYFDVENANGFEQTVVAQAQPFIFVPYYSARPGDTLVVGSDYAGSLGNQGSFVIASIPSTSSLTFTNQNGVAESVAIGATDAIGINDQGFSTYRQVTCVAPDPANPSTYALVLFTPGTDAALLNSTAGAAMSFPNRLGFPSTPVPGVSAYQYWTGLKQTAQRVVSGWSGNPTAYSGYQASGVRVRAREPQIQQVSFSAQIATQNGTLLSSIAPTIQSNVTAYVQSLGLGGDVILSEVISVMQATPGVHAVVLVSPPLSQEEVVVNDKCVARTSPAQINLTSL
jgi:uncharacterized phage protein gp47/JayE